MLFFLAVFASGLLVAAYAIFTWNNAYFKERGIPYLKPLPFVGNALPAALMMRSFADFFEDKYKELKDSRLGGLFLGPNPVLLVCDPELIKLVLVKDSEYFPNRAFKPDEKGDPLPSKLGFFVTGDSYRSMARRAKTIFGITKLKKMFPPVLGAGLFSSKKFNTVAKRSEPVDVMELANVLSMDITMSLGGVNDDVIVEEGLSALRKIMDPSVRRMFGFFLAAEFPWVVRYIPLKIVEDSFVQLGRNIMKEVCRARLMQKGEKNDLMNILLDWMSVDGVTETLLDDVIIPNKNGNKEAQDWESDDFLALIVTYLIGSGESNGRALAFGFYEMAMNPKVQGKVYEEIDSVLEQCEGKMTYEAFQELQYLEMVVLETLRKHTPFPVTNRKCEKNYQIPGTKYVIEKGMHIYVSMKGLHYDAEYYPEPDKFDPERFTEENKKKRPSCTYMPFGAGPRICMAAKYSVMLMKAIMFSVLSKYEVYAYEDTVSEFTLHPKAFFIHPKEKLLVKLREREQCHEIKI